MLLLHVFHAKILGTTSATETLVATTNGHTVHKGAQTRMTETLSVVTHGHKRTHGGTGITIILSSAGTVTHGHVRMHSHSTSTETFAATTTGHRGWHGATSFVGTLGAFTNGDISGVTFYSIRLTATNSGGSNTKTLTNYIRVQRKVFGSFSFAGMLTATTTPKGPDVRIYSVRLTATNSSGSNTKTRTAYINVLQPKPSFSFTGTLHAFTAGKTIHKGASTSEVETLHVTTSTTPHGKTTFVGTLHATTTPKTVGNHWFALGGWGVLWGDRWGGPGALDQIITLHATTKPSGAVTGTTAFHGTLAATTHGKVNERSHTTTTVTLAATTAGKRIRHGQTSFLSVLNVTTRGQVVGHLTPISTQQTVTLHATTHGKVNEHSRTSFIGTLSVTTSFFSALPNLTEFPAIDIDLTELVGAGVSLGGSAVSPIDLTEVPA
jgi:PKD repeat protein